MQTRNRKSALFMYGMTQLTTAWAQVATIDPQIRTKATAQENVTVVEVAAHFVTAIRLPEAVYSVVVGDPALFQVNTARESRLLAAASASTTVIVGPATMVATPKQAQSLDELLERQKQVPLPALYGERIRAENVKGDRLRAGISEVSRTRPET